MIRATRLRKTMFSVINSKTIMRIQDSNRCLVVDLKDLEVKDHREVVHQEDLLHRITVVVVL